MRIIIFLALSFAASWAIGGAIHAGGGLAQPLGAVLLIAYMAGPALGALVTAAIFDRHRYATALGLKGRPMPKVLQWIIAGWVAAILLAGLALVIGAGLAATTGQGGFANPVDTLRPLIDEALAQNPEALEELPFSVDMLVVIQLAIGVPVGIAINTVILTVTEEIGWRGYLQPRLTERGLAFWPMCLVTGLIWGLWHAPVIVMGHNYPGEPVLGPVLMVIFCVLLTPLVALMAERGLTYAAGAFHGAINAVAGIALLFQDTPADWMWRGLIGLPGFAVLAASCILIFFWRKANPPAPAQAISEPAASPAPGAIAE